MQFGTVVDINDPEKLGRVKVKIYGLHDNIESKELGWSKCLTSTNTPAQLGHGASINLQVGTLVSCVALDITLQEFIVTGTLPTKTDGAKDNNVRVRGEANPHANEPLGTYEPGSSYGPVYPYNNVYATESGHVKEYDDTPGAERIMERHKSGTQYEIQPNGSKVQRIVSDNYCLVAGHDTVEVTGNVRIIVSGHCDLAVSKDLNAQVGGNMTSTITGNSTSTVTGNMTADITGTANITSNDNMILKVPTQVESTTVSGAWGPSGKKITLSGNVDVTHTLRTNTDSVASVSGGSDAINLNTHIHTQGNDSDGNTQAEISVPVPEE